MKSNLRIIITSSLSFLLFLSCKDAVNKVKEASPVKVDIKVTENALTERGFYSVVYRELPDKVQEYLDAGFDPDYCKGESGWIDSNPLAVVAEGFYTTFYRTLHGDIIPDPTPDVATLQVLVKGGANVNKRPYIWERVHKHTDIYTDAHFNKRWNSTTNNGKPEGTEAGYKAHYIQDVNRIVEAFLKAGANPDLPGHPYPFSYEAIKARISDEQAQEYFSKGTRAINDAIAKGMAWESLVDLLLEYTQLDEESLKAAERSNDTEMVKKIQKLWQAQNSK